jgi:hypothetical protein
MELPSGRTFADKQVAGFRRVATRYEKRACNHLAMVKLAAVLVWPRPVAPRPGWRVTTGYECSSQAALTRSQMSA